MQNKFFGSKLNTVLLVIVVVVFIVLFAVFYNKNSKQTEQQLIGNFDVAYDVVVKENPTDTLKSDIYLKDKATEQEDIFTTLSDVYREHYHNAEFNNGNIYILKRTGGDFGYENNPNWTDELWKYNQQKQGVKIYSSQGLDFRVSNDEKFIAIFDGGAMQTITFLKNDGKIIKVLTLKDLGLENPDIHINPLVWSDNALWLQAGFTDSIQMVAKIDPITFQITKFDLGNLAIQTGDFSLNPNKQKIAFSDYPGFFDAVASQDFSESKKPVTLFLYDLVNKSRQTISTSRAKVFNPQWIDETTLEYNNPNGGERIQFYDSSDNEKLQ